MSEQNKKAADSGGWTLLLYGCVSIAVLYVLYDYVRPNLKEPVSLLSFFIYLIGLIGMVIFYNYNIGLGEEMQWSEAIQGEVEEVLRQVKARTRQFNLHELRQMTSKNESLFINRMLNHIATEAESKKFDSSLTILSIMKEEFAARTMRVFGFQKVALQLGILGTFIGLAMAFKDMSGAKIDDRAIDHLLRSLQIPFSTSIAGLQVAFILWMHIDFLQRRQGKLFQVMETCLDHVINLARHAIYKDSITVELQHVSTRIDAMSGRIEQGNELLISQAAQIAEGIGKLRTANAELNTFREGLAERQEKFMESISGLYDSLSPKQIGREMSEGLKIGTRDISELMSQQARQNAELMDGYRKQMFDSLGQMLDMQKKYVEMMTKTDMQKYISEAMSSASGNVAREVRANFDRLLPPVAALAKEIAEYNEIMRPKLPWWKRIGRRGAALRENAGRKEMLEA